MPEELRAKVKARDEEKLRTAQGGNGHGNGSAASRARPLQELEREMMVAALKESSSERGRSVAIVTGGSIDAAKLAAILADKALPNFV